MTGCGFSTVGDAGIPTPASPSAPSPRSGEGWGEAGVGMPASPPALKPQPVMEAVLVPAPQEQRAPLSTDETLLSQTKVMTIGRQPGAYLLIDNDSVSRRHAEISHANGQYILRDVGSANGTFVNDVRLEPGSVHMLKPGDQLRFGKVKFVFKLRGAGGAGAPLAGTLTRLRSGTLPGMTKLQEMTTGFFDPAARRDQPGLYSPPTGQPVLNADGSLLLPGATTALPANVVATFKESPALVVVAQGTPQVVYLKQGKRITLGRDKTNDVPLADVAASRKHAEILYSSDGFSIRDLASANGVVVNSAKIDNPYLLVHGDRMMIGSTPIFFIDIRQESLERASAGERQGERHTCGNCGAPNLRIARFCATCGTPLENPGVPFKG